MNRWLILLIMISLSAVAQQPTSVLSFIEWKAQQIQQAQGRLIDSSKAKIRTASNTIVPTTGRRLVSQKGELAEEQDPSKLALSVANGLTVQDYFSLYLVPLNSEQAFAEAVAKLRPEEVTELLRSYRKSLGSTDATILVQPTETKAASSRTTESDATASKTGRL